MKRFAVITLNWNGVDDTIDCIDSIFKHDHGAVPIIIDNGSTDGSGLLIQKALAKYYSHTITGSYEEIVARKLEIGTSDAILVLGRENVGFAAGCNLGLKIAQAGFFKYSVFLNNDTIIEAAALSRIVEKLSSNKEYFAVLPMIIVHGTDKIWNCGGYISRLGFRRYYHAGKEPSDLKQNLEITCSFFTGCCFAVRTAEFASRGGFIEYFFFGEEDFELALWMLDHGLKALCLTNAIIRHKVSSSVSRASGLEASKIFVHYLNRFIHMRKRFGNLRWAIWVSLYIPYVGLLLIRGKSLPISKVPNYLCKLIELSFQKITVSKSDFEYFTSKSIW